MVPAWKPVPVTVHVTLPIRIVSLPLTKSPAARWVNVAVEADPVLTFAVTETAFSLAGTEGVASGSASGKWMLVCPIDNVALALTVALTVKFCVAVTAKAPVAIKTKPKPITNTKLTFLTFSSSFSFLIPFNLGDEGNHFFICPFVQQGLCQLGFIS